MRVTCKRCGWTRAGLSKSQCYDQARFEGCPCGGNLSIFDADWQNDVERDLKDIEALESDHEEYLPLWARW